MRAHGPCQAAPQLEATSAVWKEGMYPSLQRRYLSSLVDATVLLCALVAGTVVYQGNNDAIHFARVVVVLIIVFSYEPILTSQLCTIGQAVCGIRVRRFAHPDKKISISRAFLRTLLKILLGFYSFFAMGFNKHRRAVHDFAADSVVIEAKEPVGFANGVRAWALHQTLIEVQAFSPSERCSQRAAA